MCSVTKVAQAFVLVTDMYKNSGNLIHRIANNATLATDHFMKVRGNVVG